MTTPSKDIALATAFPSYLDAANMAERIGADDAQWVYGVQRINPVRYVIAVYDGNDEDSVFLGYL